MEQSLKDERLDKMIQHAAIDEQIDGLQAKKLELHKRITQIEHYEASMRSSTDASLNRTIDAGGVGLGKQ